MQITRLTQLLKCSTLLALKHMFKSKMLAGVPHDMGVIKVQERVNLVVEAVGAGAVEAVQAVEAVAQGAVEANKRR